MSRFGARLRTAMDTRGPLCVGVDPHPQLLRQWGLDDDPAGLDRFARTCVEALGDTVAVLKPQSAFFERHGSAGIAVLERLVADARARGALVLLDVKRGDIGSTMQGYADAYLRQTSPLAVDAITVSPYLGFESLRPALRVAAEEGAGVFVLARTSNPEAAVVQHATSDGTTVAGQVLAAVAAENAGDEPLGSVGAVVGANLRDVTEDLAVNGPLLAPGFGAQGGTVADLAGTFASVLDLVLPATSRAVLSAGPEPEALRAAAQSAVRDVTAVLGDPAEAARR
jgi:orotidine-5'-phosphate decarboxylase